MVNIFCHNQSSFKSICESTTGTCVVLSINHVKSESKLWIILQIDKKRSPAKLSPYVQLQLSLMMGWTDSVWQMCLQHNLSIIVQQQVQQMFSEVHFDNRQLLLMRPSRYKTKTMRLRLGDESYSAPSVHQTQQVRIAKGCCHHYKLETKHVSSSIFTNLAVFCSKGGGVSNPCSNIAKGTTDPRVEFIMPK